MEYIIIMQRFETSNNLDEDLPDLLFRNVLLHFLVLSDLLEEVTVVGEFHDDAII